VISAIWPRLAEASPKIAEHVEIAAKYAVYLDRQAADIAAYRRDEGLALPGDLDFADIEGLSNEARQKLAAQRPRTLGQAARIDGITPAAIALLAVHLRRGPRRRAAAP
jgi:tRNA uridine 5-carboxymethylaminomethyl modification enzyme